MEAFNYTHLPLNLTYNYTYNLSDCSLQSDQLNSPYFQTVVYVVYSVVFFISLLGNGTVCYIVVTSPRMRTVTNFFIVNLAVGDILITILCIPFTAISYMSQYWPFDALLCPLVNYSQGVSVFVSAYTLVAISVDRYVAIMWPLKPRLSKKSSGFVIFTVWCVATVTALPIAVTSKLNQPDEWFQACDLYLCKEMWNEIGEGYGQMYTKALLILQYVVPLSVLLFTYTSIAVMIWCHRIPGEAENCRDQRIARSKRKMIKMMITVVIVYTVCWLPLNIFWIIVDNYNIDEKLLMYLWFSSHWFAMSHTCYNPIIYCYMNARFRQGFLQAVASIPCARKCCTSILLMQHQSTSFPLTSVGGSDSTILHRNNTYTTYISMRRKNGSRLSNACSTHVPVRSASVMRNNLENRNSLTPVVRRNRFSENIMENEM